MLEDLRQIARLLAQGSPRITFDEGVPSGELFVRLDTNTVGRDLRVYTQIFHAVKGEAEALLDFYIEVVMSLIKYLSDEVRSQVRQKLLDLGATMFNADSLALWQEIIS